MKVARYAALALFNVLAAGVTPTLADLDKKDVDRIITKAMEGFWGHAVGYHGQILEPADEKERKRLLIPRADAERVVNEAIVYGLAVWCEVDWKPVYLEYIQVEMKKKGWGEKQRAFIGVLFGLTQATIQQSMPRPCNDDEKKRLAVRLREERERLRSLYHVK